MSQKGDLWNIIKLSFLRVMKYKISVTSIKTIAKSTMAIDVLTIKYSIVEN